MTPDHLSLNSDYARQLHEQGFQADWAGNFESAVAIWRQCLAEYVALIGTNQDHPLRVLATGLKTCIGSALIRLNRLDEALLCFDEALMEFASIEALNKKQRMSNIARTQAVKATALLHLNRRAESLTCSIEALTQFDALIAPGDKEWMDLAAASRAQVGCVLSALNRSEEALGFFNQALLEFGALIFQGDSTHAFAVAELKVNIGISWGNQSRPDKALAYFTEGLAECNLLIEKGHESRKPFAARTNFLMGSALRQQGKMDEALVHLEHAKDAYKNLIEYAKQWQHIYEFDESCRALREGWIHKLLSVAQPGGGTTQPNDWKRGLEVIEATLAEQSRLVPSTANVSLQHLQALFPSANNLWGEAADRGVEKPWVKDCALKLLSVWLDHLAHLLLDDAVFLTARFERDIAPMLNQTFKMAMDLGRPNEIADWFLKSQGVRVQRLGLLQAQANDPDVATLLGTCQKLDVLALEVAGDHSSNNASHRKKMAVLAYQTLRTQEFEPLKKRLTDAGKYPAPQRVTLTDIRHQLRQLHSVNKPTAVVLLMPVLLPKGSLLVAVRLGEQVQDDRLWRLPMPSHGTRPHPPGLRRWFDRTRAPKGQQIDLQAMRTAWQRLRADAQTKAKTARSSRGIAGAGIGLEAAAAVVSGWRGGVLQTENPAVSPVDPRVGAVNFEEDELADDERHQLLHGTCLKAAQVLLPCLRDLHADGVRAVHVIPAGDWHTVPWAAELDQAIPGLAVRQFPTAVGWRRVMQSGETDRTSSTVRRGAPASIRWASLTYDATEHRGYELFWAGAEQAALAGLWRAALPQQAPHATLSPQRPAWPATGNASQSGDSEPADGAVNCLVCIGHGDVPDGNLALAGMLLPATRLNHADHLPAEQFALFTAAHLHQIRHAHRLVMSCCVLGRIGDAHGEPLGMTALAFAFNTRFAVGSMLPIPDLEGALFSMALHYAWSLAEASRASTDMPTDWAGVFHAVRRQVIHGRWPDGFGQWLVEVWWPLLHELTNNEEDQLATFRLQILSRLVRLSGGLSRWASVPSKAVGEVAAVTVCLG